MIQDYRVLWKYFFTASLQKQRKCSRAKPLSLNRLWKKGPFTDQGPSGQARHPGFYDAVGRVDLPGLFGPYGLAGEGQVDLPGFAAVSGLY
jgi:hypothetical protein